jgi:hypothetical protein
LKKLITKKAGGVAQRVAPEFKPQYCKKKEKTATKRNELSSHEKIWQKLKCILLSKRSQYKKSTYCMIQTISHSRKGKTVAMLKRSMIAWD